MPKGSSARSARSLSNLRAQTTWFAVPCALPLFPSSSIILVPAAPILLKRHPKLELEFVADARDLSLTRREADLALRLARPKTGGTKVTARRVGTLRYDVYASASRSVRSAKMLPWITYDEAMAHLPQARWIAAAAVRNDEKIAAVRVNDAEAVLEAVI